MMLESYGEVIVKTFRKNAIHTALLVDDNFPTYQELCDSHRGEERGPYQIDESADLHATFFKQSIPCDVENNIERIETNGLKHLRKSDLIVLDYHLREDDSSASIGIIKELMESKHFNIVVLYTSEIPAKAWLEIAVQLRGGWEDKVVSFNDEESGHWDLFDFEVNAADVTDYIIGEKILSRLMVENKARFDEDEVPLPYRLKFIEAKIHEYVLEEVDSEVIGQHLVDMKSNCRGANCWLQIKNLFLVIKQKHAPTDNESDPRGVIEALDHALIDWNPNPFQVMISNIQNILEREGLATDSEYFGNKHFQMGLAYSMASQFTEKADMSKIIPVTLKKVQEDLLEYLQQRISKQVHSQGLAQTAFESSVLPVDDEKDVKAIVKKILREAIPDGCLETILFDRNAFVSTQEFSEMHITNGTVFRLKNENEEFDYWVCSYASCDLVPRKNDKECWRDQLFPFRPFTAVKLNLSEGSLLANVKKADRARTIFLHCDGDKLCFDALDNTDTPDLEQMYGANALVVDSLDGKKVFNAQRLNRVENEQKEKSLQLDSCSFEVVGQLRRAYASRLLAKVANYKARIGLDYISPRD